MTWVDTQSAASTTNDHTHLRLSTCQLEHQTQKLVQPFSPPCTDNMQEEAQNISRWKKTKKTAGDCQDTFDLYIKRRSHEQRTVELGQARSIRWKKWRDCYHLQPLLLPRQRQDKRTHIIRTSLKGYGKLSPHTGCAVELTAARLPCNTVRSQYVVQGQLVVAAAAAWPATSPIQHSTQQKQFSSLGSHHTYTLSMYRFVPSLICFIHS